MGFNNRAQRFTRSYYLDVDSPLVYLAQKSRVKQISL